MSAHLPRPEPGHSLILYGDKGFWYDTANLSRPAGQGANMGVVGHTVAPSGIGLWVVAAGLNGHSGSEVAAKLAVDTIMEHFRTTPAFGTDGLGALFNAASTALREARSNDPANADIATTLLVLLSDGMRAVWARVGDSRLYLCRGGRASPVTNDNRNAGRDWINAIPPSASDLVLELGTDLQLHRDDALLLWADGSQKAVLDLEIAVDYAKSDSTADWIRYLDWRIRGRSGEQSDGVSAIAVRPCHPELPTASSLLLAVSERPNPSGKGGSNRRWAIRWRVIGLYAGCFLLALILGIQTAHTIFAMRTESLATSIADHAATAKKETNDAIKAVKRAEIALTDALTAASDRDANLAGSKLQSADADTQTASRAAKAARDAATLAVAGRDEFTNASWGLRRALGDASTTNSNTAHESAKQAEDAVRKVLEAMAGALADVPVKLSETAAAKAKQQADIAKSEAKVSTDAATAIKNMTNKRSREATDKVALAKQHAAKAEEARGLAEEAAAAAEKLWEKSQPWFSETPPSWMKNVTDARSEAEEAKASAQKAKEAADRAEAATTAQPPRPQAGGSTSASRTGGGAAPNAKADGAGGAQSPAPPRAEKK